MKFESRRAPVTGAFIALVVPISYLLLAVLVEHGIAPYDEIHSLLSLLGLVAATSLVVLGPIGIAIAGWSLGIRGIALIGFTLVVMLPLAIVWFVCVVTLSGTLGNPF